MAKIECLFVDAECTPGCSLYPDASLPEGVDEVFFREPGASITVSIDGVAAVAQAVGNDSVWESCDHAPDC